MDMHDAAAASSIKNRLDTIQQEVAGALTRTGRDPDSVRIVAVTKYILASDMAPLVAAGLRLFGENRWQVAKPKVELTYDNSVEWHFIGRLQKNKIQQVARHFSWIHSVDSLELLSAISVSAGRQGVTPECLVQVNVSGEATKQGVQPEEILTMVRQGLCLPNVRLRGLMTMAPLMEDTEATRSNFRSLHDLQQEVQMQTGCADFDQLSMGMSQDYVVAVEEGATLIRIGRKLVLSEGSKESDSGRRKDHP